MELHTNIPTPLEKLYHWEKARPRDLYMTQPIGNGRVEEYTWQRTADEVRRMASYLKAQGFEEGAKIGILSKNCAHWVMADLAIWMAGYISVPLYPTLSAGSVSQILEHSETQLLFVGKLDDWDMMKPGVPDDMKCVSFPLSPPNDYENWDALIAQHEPYAENPPRKHEELATIIYTSGSTGQPKGVMTSFDAMCFASHSTMQEMGVTSNDRFLSYLPMSHVFERYLVEQGSLQAGFHIFFAESLDTFLADLQRAKPTLFISVPRLWTKFQAGVLAKLPQEKLNKLLKIPGLSYLIRKKVLKGLGLEDVRMAGSGSAPLSQDIINWYRRLGLELLEGYGMSENFAYSHLTRPGRVRVGYVGEPMSGVQQRISPEGEVQIKSAASMMGYYKAPDLTADAFTEDGFLKTGDLGEIDELGRLKLTGRSKELFKTSKGKYVAPAPIENRVVSHPDIEMCCVSGVDYPQPHCLLVLSEDAYPKRNDPAFREQFEASILPVMEEINRTVDPHEALQFVCVVNEQWAIENGFLTPTMKMKRNVVEDVYRAHWDNWYAARKKVIWQ